MPDNVFAGDAWWRNNQQGSLILQDAGLSISQLSGGSYNRMIDALDNGSSFTFNKNKSGKYDVNVDKKDFWSELFSGSTNGFLGALTDKQENGNQSESGFEKFFGKYSTIISQVMGGNYGMAGATFATTEAGANAGKKLEEWEDKYGGLFIRAAIVIIGAILLAVSVAYLFKGEITGAVVGKALKG